MRLSVVLCTFNGSRYLPAMLGSLVGQDRPPDELVAVDDGSEDSTVEQLVDFAERSPFPVRLGIGLDHLGSTKNFERALQRATGDVVALADQDDVWRIDKLARLGGRLCRAPRTSLVFSDASLIDANGRPLRRRLWRRRGLVRLGRGPEVVDPRLLAQRPLVTGCTMAVTRSVIEAALPFPRCLEGPRWPMRHDRWLSLVAAGLGETRLDREPLVAFRVHPGQETGVLVGRDGMRRRVVAVGRAARSPVAESVIRHRERRTQLCEAAARVTAAGGDATFLGSAADHHAVRASLDSHRAVRIPVVWGELRSGGYGPGAAGVASALADVVRR